ncbi:hypothetical protein N8I84_24730 [Streptomyces cynarae]|uniref:Extensin n=1 Tax=Streptomyces cynarae TaxID=2981134 RepID=A0ABY6E6V5_9ACTN|nr:hypothetical protein [Streptomyces cynarae]UXY21536.1 hypothetical protein N8I84_24730 [Streptomyces cynarae]
MADEQDRWLDRDAAERLLRGEPPAPVDADARARAERLAEALAALTATPSSTSEELPGEEAAVAAFRAVRAARNDNGTVLQPQPAALPQALDFARVGGTPTADAGLVRLGRPEAGGRRARRWRTVRFGLAATVAAGMIGGVAVAAGTGVLPTPFRDDPGPAASVSPALTSPHPSATGTPGATGTGGLSSATPGGTTGAPGRDGSPSDEALDGSTATGRLGDAGNRAAGRTGDRWTEVRSSCRDMAGGKLLGPERLRDLADAAGGSGRVKAYCKGVLGGGDEGSGRDGSGKGRDGNGSGGGNGSGDGKGNGNTGGDGDQGGNSGDGEGHIAPVAPAPTAPRGLVGPVPTHTAAPSPTYSALGSAENY